MPNVLQEYLVALGFETDVPSFSKFKNLMEQAEKTVTTHSSGIAKRLLEVQTSVVGGFTAISAAIIGVVDKAAMADQAWRLMGEKMLMTTEQARKLDLITKALGADLGQITWDPELRQRAGELAQDIDKMSTALGPDFEKRMKGIRDLRFEFSRLEVAVQFLGMQFAGDLFKKLFPNSDALNSLSTWVDNFEEKLPELSDKLSTYAIPVLKDTWEILKGLGEVLKAGGLAFQNLVGLLSGDSSIQGTEATFEGIAKAIEHCEQALVKFLNMIASAEKSLAHFLSGASLGFSGNKSGAENQIQKSADDVLGLLPSSPNSKETDIGGSDETKKKRIHDTIHYLTGGPDPTPFSKRGPQDILGAYSTGEKLRDWLEKTFPTLAKHLPDYSKPSSSQPHQDRFTQPSEASSPQSGGQPIAQQSQQPWNRGDIINAIVTAADKYGVPQAMALAVAKHESGFNPNATNLNKNKTTDYGVMQLNDSTVKTAGVKNPLDPQENIETGVKLLGSLLERYQGDQAKALAAYSAGAGRVDKTPDFAQLPDVTRKAVPEILQIEKRFLTETPESLQTDLFGKMAASMRPEQAKSLSPSIQNSPQLTQGGVPDWYATTPDFMKEVPEWYGTAPSWLTQNAGKDSPSTPKATLESWMIPDKQQANFSNWNQTYADMQRPTTATASGPTNNNQTITMGGISVYVAQPGATQYQIQRAVEDGVRDALARQTQSDLVQLQPIY